MPQETSSVATKWQKEGYFKVISVGQASVWLSFPAPDSMLLEGTVSNPQFPAQDG